MLAEAQLAGVLEGRSPEQRLLDTLNLAWTGLFFALRRPGLAFGEILLLWAAILATLGAFGRVSRVAGLLLFPYLAWVTFAAALNLAIWRLNP